MKSKLVPFLAIVLTALALVPTGAHLLEMPNKIGLERDQYFVVQNIYRGWALLGTVLVAALLANALLALRLRHQPWPFALALAAALALAVTLITLFLWTYPANVATDNWTAIPADWERLRWQWERTHALNAVITFAGFCAVVLAVLTGRDEAGGSVARTR